MSNNILELKEEISIRVIEYFSKMDITQIPHTINVAYFTRLIAESEHYEPRKIYLLEIAALMHDIGCPISRIKYGNSLPKNQEKEGKIITEEWMNDYELTKAERNWLANIVGNHHQFRSATTLNFEALFDADLIVNTIESGIDASNIQRYEKLLSTQTGKEIFRVLFLDKDA